jgi:fatty acid desaturase
MSVLPEPTPTAPAAGQATNPLSDAVISAAVDNAIHESRRRSTSPPPAQSARPPMSSKAVDDSVRMLSASVLIATGGGATTAILWASGYANPAVVALVFGAPTALTLALGRLAKRARGVLPDEHHHHYDGPVYQDQRNVHSSTRGVWAKTNNNP